MTNFTDTDFATESHMYDGYRDILTDILDIGVRTSNRTGVDTIMVPGQSVMYNLSFGHIPLLTSKYINFSVVAGELIGFLNACTSAADFRALGVNIWNKDANENGDWLNNPYRKGHDDLGKIYGYQWRQWETPDGQNIDQFMNVIKTIRENPSSRRIIMTGWNPAQLEEMALPPCHLLYQFIADPERKRLHLCMYQRSADMFLGVPFNTASCALLLNIVCMLTGYEPGQFTHFMADCHIYENHVEQVKTLLSRDEYTPPKLLPSNAACSRADTIVALPFDPRRVSEFIEDLTPEDFRLVGYTHHPAIKAEMATTPVK